MSWRRHSTGTVAKRKCDTDGGHVMIHAGSSEDCRVANEAPQRNDEPQGLNSTLPQLVPFSPVQSLTFQADADSSPCRRRSSPGSKRRISPHPPSGGVPTAGPRQRMAAASEQRARSKSTPPADKEATTLITPIPTSLPRRKSDERFDRITEITPSSGRINYSDQPPAILPSEDLRPAHGSIDFPELQREMLPHLVAQAVPNCDQQRGVLEAMMSLIGFIDKQAVVGKLDVEQLFCKELGPAMLSAIRKRQSFKMCSMKSEQIPSSVHSDGANMTDTMAEVEVESDQHSFDPACVVRLSFRGRVYHGLQMEGPYIKFMARGNQFLTKDVKAWWRVLAVDSESVNNFDELRAAVDSKRDLVARDFKITFLADLEHAAIHHEKQRKLLFRTLRSLKRNDNVDFFFLEQERTAVLKDKECVSNLLMHQRVHEMEVLLGKATAAEMESFLELLACIGADLTEEVRRIVSQRCVLLAMGDEDACTAIQHVRSKRCLELLLEHGPPGIGRKRNSSGQTAASMALSRESSLGDVFVDHDIGALLGIDTPDGRCGAMYLDSSALESFEHVLPQWKHWAEALASDVDHIAGSLEMQALRVIALSHDVNSDDDTLRRCIVEPLHFHLFGERCVWEAGTHSSRSLERLGQVETPVLLLFEALVDNPEAAKPLKALLQATKGPRHSKLDPREPWREKLDMAVAAFEGRMLAILQDEFNALLALDESKWLTTLEDELRVSGSHLRNDSQAPGCPTWTHPEWVWEHDFDAALRELHELGIFSKPSAVSTFTRQVGATGVGLQSLDRHETTFMRLHALQRREVCQSHVDHVRDWFALFSTKFHCECRARRVAKSIERVLVKASMYADEAVASGDTVLHRDLQTAGDYVTDINGVELVAPDLATLRSVFDMICSYTWEDDGAQLVRIKNGYSTEFQTDTGYRDLKLWVLVNIQELPLTVEVQLHLKAFHKFKACMHVAYEYRRGSYDHEHVQPACPSRSGLLLRLREATSILESQLQGETACTSPGLDHDPHSVTGQSPPDSRDIRAVAVCDLEKVSQEIRDVIASIMEDSIAQSDRLLHEVSKATSLLTKTDSHIAMRKALMNAMATSGAECNPASAYRSLAAVVGDAEECGVECTEAHKHLAELKEAWRSDVLKNLQSALQSTKPAYLDAALRDAHALGFENEVTALVAQRRADLAPLARSLNEKLMSSINDPAQIQSLLGDSADPNFVNERGVSVLHLAVQRKRVDAITIILEAGADPNMSSKMGNTPLHAVAQLEADDDTFSIARLLITARSEVNNQSTDGWRPLHHAVVQTRQRCENRIIKGGCGHLVERVEDRTVRMDIVSLLLTNKASVNKKLPDTTDARYAGAAPLHLATETGNEEAVSLLLTWKPKVDARNACGDTPLWLAVNRGDVSIVERLLEARADSTGVDQSSNTLLHQVALSGNGGLTELLVKYMADLNARNAQGLTPLAVARGHGRGVTALTVACELEQLGARS